MHPLRFPPERPRTDDRPIWDLLFGIYGYPAVLVAHDLKLFPLLGAKPRTLEEICEALRIHPRPAEALLTVCLALGLVQREGGRYTLTPIAEDYLLESSPTYFGGFLDSTISNYSLWSFESLKKAVLTNAPQVYGGRDMFQSHEEEARLARSFTRAMHSASMGPALAWPELIDLSEHHTLLDVGGGSGAHAIGAALRWEHLDAIVLELPRVCEVAREFAAAYGLEARIRTVEADMWKDPFPPADLHFYSMIYHDWPPERCRFLSKKSYETLAPGGRIILHEMLLNDEKTGPFAVAAFNIDMLLWDRGQQYSGPELSLMLTEAGFSDIEVRSTFGYWSVVTGRKA
ncbi:MAG: methyltransferase [Deltaproteobacteria bacterium]|nr:methyltransferase [Deltaproteobacteria bacterium]